MANEPDIIDQLLAEGYSVEEIEAAAGMEPEAPAPKTGASLLDRAKETGSDFLHSIAEGAAPGYHAVGGLLGGLVENVGAIADPKRDYLLEVSRSIDGQTGRLGKAQERSPMASTAGAATGALVGAPAAVGKLAAGAPGLLRQVGAQSLMGAAQGAGAAGGMGASDAGVRDAMITGGVVGGALPAAAGAVRGVGRGAASLIRGTKAGRGADAVAKVGGRGNVDMSKDVDEVALVEAENARQTVEGGRKAASGAYGKELERIVGSTGEVPTDSIHYRLDMIDADNTINGKVADKQLAGVLEDVRGFMTSQDGRASANMRELQKALKFIETRAQPGDVATPENIPYRRIHSEIRDAMGELSPDIKQLNSRYREAMEEAEQANSVLYGRDDAMAGADDSLMRNERAASNLTTEGKRRIARGKLAEEQPRLAGPIRRAEARKGAEDMRIKLRPGGLTENVTSNLGALSARGLPAADAVAALPVIGAVNPIIAAYEASERRKREMANTLLSRGEQRVKP